MKAQKQRFKRMNDFFSFRRMLTPWLIQVLFWGGVAGSALSASLQLFELHWFKSIGILVFGLIGTRIGCEILMLFFRMNETLTDIKHLLRSQGDKDNDV